MSQLSVGAVVFDEDGIVVHATGHARSPAVQQILRAQLPCLNSGHGQSVRAVSVDGCSYTVQIFRCSESWIALMLEVDNARQMNPVEAIGCDALSSIVGVSAGIQALKREIARIAPMDVSVLIAGESGTGKELVARAIHRMSRRKQSSCVSVNTAALPATLFESEFFGYEAGAFTGADRRGKRGRFEQANTGTLFLDEIGDMPSELQVKLLRVLQDGCFERLGGDQVTHSDFRLVCATNADMRQLIAAGKFRLDLFYRISSVTLRVPPLRERPEDIPLLVQTFLEAFACKNGTPTLHVNEGAIRALQAQAWPGNVRQLQHEVEKAAIFANGGEIGCSDFQFAHESKYQDIPSVEPTDGSETVKSVVDQVEMALVKDALIRFGGNKKRAAEALGISRGYLYKMLARPAVLASVAVA